VGRTFVYDSFGIVERRAPSPVLLGNIPTSAKTGQKWGALKF
jgi:hypothetical protein